MAGMSIVVPRMDLSITVAYIINENGNSLVESGTSANSTITEYSVIYGAAGIISSKGIGNNNQRQQYNGDLSTFADDVSRGVFYSPTLRPSTIIKIRLRTSTPTRTTTTTTTTTSVSLDIIDPAAASFPAAAPGLTIERPGLAARILGFNRLLKKLCSISCCVGLGTPEDR